VRIQLNGEPRDLARALSIAELLDELGIDGRTVAVEHNRLVVRRAKYAETMLQEGSEVEIVAFVGGGR
jgi:sulfur carrier protein